MRCTYTSIYPHPSLPAHAPEFTCVVYTYLSLPVQFDTRVDNLFREQATDCLVKVPQDMIPADEEVRLTAQRVEYTS